MPAGGGVAARRAKYADLVPIDPLCSDLLGEAVAALDAEHCQLYWILRDEALLAFGAGYDKQVVAHGTARLVDYPFPPDLLAHAVQRAAREHYWATRKRGV